MKGEKSKQVFDEVRVAGGEPYERLKDKAKWEGCSLLAVIMGWGDPRKWEVTGEAGGSHSVKYVKRALSKNAQTIIKYQTQILVLVDKIELLEKNGLSAFQKKVGEWGDETFNPAQELGLM